MPQSTEELQVAINLWIEDNSSPSLEYFGDINTWNVSFITDMSNLFANQPYFNDDLSFWDVSNVENMENMFSGASSFNQNISEWNISSVTNIGNLVLALLISIWAVRLGSFLFLRIHKAGEDKRFRKIKPSPSQFFMTWTLQGLWVSLCSMCALT